MGIQKPDDAVCVVTPDCRYGHGTLLLVEDGEGSRKWSISNSLTSSTFSGNIYICKKCGYTEFFDDDIERTRNDMGLEE